MQTKNIQYEFHINEFQITFNTAYSQQFTSKNSHNKQLPREGVANSDVDARYDISIFVEISRYRYFRYFSAYRCIDTRYGYIKLNYHCVKPKNGRKVCCFRQLCELYFIYCKVKLI